MRVGAPDGEERVSPAVALWRDFHFGITEKKENTDDELQVKNKEETWYELGFGFEPCILQKNPVFAQSRIIFVGNHIIYLSKFMWTIKRQAL